MDITIKTINTTLRAEQAAGKLVEEHHRCLVIQVGQRGGYIGYWQGTVQEPGRPAGRGLVHLFYGSGVPPAGKGTLPPRYPAEVRGFTLAHCIRRWTRGKIDRIPPR